MAENSFFYTSTVTPETAVLVESLGASVAEATAQAATATQQATAAANSAAQVVIDAAVATAARTAAATSAGTAATHASNAAGSASAAATSASNAATTLANAVLKTDPSYSGNAATATKLATARTINGVAFDGTANITVADGTKLPLAGGNLTGDLTTTGSLGVGTTTPQTKLEVSGTVRINSDNSNLRLLNLAGNGGGWVTAPVGAGGGIWLASDAGPMVFNTNAVDRMRLDASGNLMVGHTSATSSPYRARFINTTGNTTVNVTGRSDISGGGAGFFVSTNATATDAIGTARLSLGTYSAITGTGTDTSPCVWGYQAEPLRFGTNNVERMSLDASGNLTLTAAGATVNIQGSRWEADKLVFATPAFYVVNQASAIGVRLDSGATGWAAQSDERTKDILEPISGATGKVGALRAVIGKYKTDPAGTRRSFLIAQDVQEVLPEAVSSDKDGILGLRYQEVIPLLVKAVQELTAEVQTLKEKLNA